MAKCNVNTQERFADIQMLRYELKGFENLSLTQKIYIYCLSKATLLGRDITFDQQGKYNLRIRKTLEAVYLHYEGNRESEDFKAFEVYLKRVWFASGIHHHYGCEKFVPGFSEESFYEMVEAVADEYLPLSKGQSKEDLLGILVPVIFNPEVMPKRVNQTDGEDLVQTSACNFYENVSQAEVERFYARMKEDGNEQAPSYGLNSKLTKRNGELVELKWTEDGLYGAAIKEIVSWLLRAQKYAENEEQKHLIDLLVKYYRTGDLKDFDRYSIAWVQQHEGMIDFINGFIEVYGDPLGLKGTWEGIVEYKDLEATKRTQTISQNAQWFEDHSPVDPRFRKPEVKGVTANVICAAMLGGEEYPASAIGINLPNANWIRQEYGYYKEKVQTMKFDGREGAAKIQSMIQTLRDNPVQKVGTYSVEKIYDYKLGTETDAATGKSEAAVLPKSNMIYYQLADGAWFLVRPSGTEPKIKFYLGVKGNSQEDAAEQLDELAANVKAMFS